MWQGNKGIVIALVAGLVIGYVAGASWSGVGNGRVAGIKTTTNNESEPAEGNSITAKDQSAGREVLVDTVKNDKPVWVAVREDQDGKAGDIIGAKLLSAAGERQNVAVYLIVPSTAGTKYHVSLYADDGDQLFDNHQDELVKNSAGAVLDAVFSTQ